MDICDKLYEFASELSLFRCPGEIRRTLTDDKLVICENLIRSDTVQPQQTQSHKHFITALFLYFDLLDIAITRKITDENITSFASKYEYMEEKMSTDDSDIVLAEVYRLLLIYRNALAHNLQGIAADRYLDVSNRSKKLRGDRIHVEYLLTLSDILCQLFLPLALKPLKEKYYLECLLFGMYASFVNYTGPGSTALFKFNDKWGSELRKPKSSPLELKVDSPRYQNHTDRYEVGGGFLTFENDEAAKPANFQIRHQSSTTPVWVHYSVDFIIEYNSKKYRIPFEALADELTIELSELGKWQILE